MGSAHARLYSRTVSKTVTLTRLLACRSDPFASHHFHFTPRNLMQPTKLRLAAHTGGVPAGPRSRGTPVFGIEHHLSRQHGPGGPGVLVGERDRRHVRAAAVRRGKAPSGYLCPHRAAKRMDERAPRISRVRRYP